MGSLSIWHWMIVLVVVMLLFGGGGKIPRVMGDLAKGVKAFKAGMKDEADEMPAAANKQVTEEGESSTGSSEHRDKSVA